MVASRDQLRELGAGFVIAEGIARYVDKVRLVGNSILVCSDTGCDISHRKRNRIFRWHEHSLGIRHCFVRYPYHARRCFFHHP